jgi:F-type H+-transporting ATPase subunit b
MLEINGWFFAQLANFLLLLVILNIMLFRPMLRLFKERESNTTGFLEDAKEMGRQQEELMSQIDARLAETRSEAKSIFEGFSKEGIDIQKETVTSSQNEAVEINRKAKEDIDSATEQARASLKTDVETFSKQIGERLVGK